MIDGTQSSDPIHGNQDHEEGDSHPLKKPVRYIKELFC